MGRPTTGTVTLARFAGYTIVFFLLLALLPVVVRHGDIQAFKEGNEIENVQLAVLAASAALLFAAGLGSGPRPALPLVLAGPAAVACVRELDSFLADLTRDGAWQVTAALVLAGIAAAVWKRRGTLPGELKEFAATRAFAMLWAGFIVAVPFGQMVGHGDFLKDLMGDDYNRGYKRMIEETGELAGYVILLLGSVETLLHFRRRPAPPRV